MLEYLQSAYDWNDPRQVAVIDEVSSWSAPFGQLLLENVPLKADLNVLDLACGTGYPLLELARVLGSSCRVTGLDPWMEALKRARVKISVYSLANAAVAMGDGAALPFEKESFDLAVSNLGVNNFAAPAKVMQEVFCTLKPGGCLALTTNPRGHMHEFYQAYADTLVELRMNDHLKALEAHVAHRFGRERLCEMLEQAGFSIRRLFQEEFKLRFLSGSALFRHNLIQYGFLDGWRSLLTREEEPRVFEHLESKLNRLASSAGELSLTIPVLYVEATK